MDPIPLREGFRLHYNPHPSRNDSPAALPARVVIGYQGGARSPVGDDWVIRQSDAHAWAEVWLAGEGWRRVDPTAAVAPAAAAADLVASDGVGHPDGARRGAPLRR